MIQAVLDANIYVSELIRPQGPPRRILRFLVEDRSFHLVGSAVIFGEVRHSVNYSRVRRYLSLRNEDIDRWIIALALIAEPTEGRLKLRAVEKDSDDENIWWLRSKGMQSISSVETRTFSNCAITRG